MKVGESAGVLPERNFFVKSNKSQCFHCLFLRSRAEDRRKRRVGFITKQGEFFRRRKHVAIHVSEEKGKPPCARYTRKGGNVKDAIPMRVGRRSSHCPGKSTGKSGGKREGGRYRLLVERNRCCAARSLATFRKNDIARRTTGGEAVAGRERRGQGDPTLPKKKGRDRHSTKKVRCRQGTRVAMKGSDAVIVPADRDLERNDRREGIEQPGKRASSKPSIC